MTSKPEDDVEDKISALVCLHHCQGVPKASSECCFIKDHDWIIGPIPDAKALVHRLSEQFGREVAFEEVLIEFDEGSRMFPEKSSWQEPSHFPAMRVDPARAGSPCVYLSEDRLCTIYKNRSVTCRHFRCDHLKSVIAALPKPRTSPEGEDGQDA